MRASSSTGTRHFTLQPLTDGVFAAMAMDGGAAICNAGLVDLGGRTLVFDTFLTPQAAEDLRRAAHEVIGPSPCIVVNSHYHNDHIWGNQAFAADSELICSRRTRELIGTAGAEEFEAYSANCAQRLASVRTQYEAGSDEERKTLLIWLGYFEGLAQAFPRLTVCVPDAAYDDRLEINGPKASARLLAFEGGHTDHDTILHLPGAGIVFVGDLLFVDCHPYLGECDPLQLLMALSAIRQLGATCLVPGHGSIGTPDDLERLAGYVEHCLAAARELAARGETSEEVLSHFRIPGAYSSWLAPEFYEANLRSLCKRFAVGAAGV